MPALFHAKQATERLGCLDRLDPVSLVGDVMAHKYRSAAEFACQASAFRFQHVADHHLRALGDQQPRLRRTLAASTTTDDYNLVLEPRHRVLPRSRIANRRRIELRSEVRRHIAGHAPLVRRDISQKQVVADAGNDRWNVPLHAWNVADRQSKTDEPRRILHVDIPQIACGARYLLQIFVSRAEIRMRAKIGVLIAMPRHEAITPQQDLPMEVCQFGARREIDVLAGPHDNEIAAEFFPRRMHHDPAVLDPNRLRGRREVQMKVGE